VGAVVTGAVGGVVAGADVVAGGRIVDGAVLATAALVAGGSAPSPLPQADNAKADASAVETMYARVVELIFFNWGSPSRVGPLGLDRGRPSVGRENVRSERSRQIPRVTSVLVSFHDAGAFRIVEQLTG
jgi:hypothetical protein